MEFRSESFVSHPVDVVYAAYRDRLPEIGAFMPDIKEIDRHKVEQRDAGPWIHNIWHANADLPKALQSLVSKDKLQWDDIATWDDAGMKVDWVIQTYVFREAVTCSGSNTFVEAPGGSKIILTGDLQIDLKKIKGIPSFLAGSLRPRVEKFIVDLIKPNLEKTNASLQAFLDSET